MNNIFNINKNEFVTSLCFSAHPLMSLGKKAKLLYFAVLEHFVNLCAPDNEFSKARLLQYRNKFVNMETTICMNDENIDKIIRKVISDFLMPWKRERCFTLLCDIALIIINGSSVQKASHMIAKYLIPRKQKKLNALLEILYNDKVIPVLFKKIKNLIVQFRANRNFGIQNEMRVIITANMSAGKSTFINAIVGKPVTRVSQEACTNNLCFLYNKPFEDDQIHLIASPVNLNATYDELITAEKNSVCSIASFFRVLSHSQARVCLIDTPGVNSAINRSHGKLARKAIVEEIYDKLIYILNANMLGTDDEIKHLKYVNKNVPNEKIIFVLNKIDCFKSVEDSISESIEAVIADLQKIGFENPVICPFSAYFSLLLKMKQNNEKLNKDEQDSFDFYVRKFSKPKYDLSSYYNKPVNRIYNNAENLDKLSFASGLYGLENILYGETIK